MAWSKPCVQDGKGEDDGKGVDATQNVSVQDANVVVSAFLNCWRSTFQCMALPMLLLKIVDVHKQQEGPCSLSRMSVVPATIVIGDAPRLPNDKADWQQD